MLKLSIGLGFIDKSLFSLIQWKKQARMTIYFVGCQITQILLLFVQIQEEKSSNGKRW